jgi:hypothetical protein
MNGFQDERKFESFLYELSYKAEPKHASKKRVVTILPPPPSTPFENQPIAQPVTLKPRRSDIVQAIPEPSVEIEYEAPPRPPKPKWLVKRMMASHSTPMIVTNFTHNQRNDNYLQAPPLPPKTYLRNFKKNTSLNIEP